MPSNNVWPSVLHWILRRSLMMNLEIMFSCQKNSYLLNWREVWLGSCGSSSWQGKIIPDGASTASCSWAEDKLKGAAFDSKECSSQVFCTDLSNLHFLGNSTLWQGNSDFSRWSLEAAFPAASFLFILEFLGLFLIAHSCHIFGRQIMCSRSGKTLSQKSDRRAVIQLIRDFTS